MNGLVLQPELELVQVRLPAGSEEEDCGCARKPLLLLYAPKRPLVALTAKGYCKLREKLMDR